MNYEKRREKRDEILDSCKDVARRVHNASIGAERSSEEDAREQEEALKNYAKENNLWYFEEDDIGQASASGQEAVVYVKGINDRVLKRLNPYVFHDSPLEFLERISISNALFPEAFIQLEGFSEEWNNYQGRKGELRIVFSQPIIEIDVNHPVPAEEIAEFFIKKGFTTTTDPKAFENDEYVIEDAHSENVIRGTDGQIYVIDVVAYSRNDWD